MKQKEVYRTCFLISALVFSILALADGQVEYYLTHATIFTATTSIIFFIGYCTEDVKQWLKKY